MLVLDISGILSQASFLGSYALWGMNPWLFSLVMNGASALATGIVTMVVLLGIGRTVPALFIGKINEKSLSHYKSV